MSTGAADLRIGASSDIGRVRETNEDAFLVIAPLIAVADGMGGAKAGDVAANLALDVLGERLLKRPEDVLAAIREANRRVWNASLSDAATRGMGTTLTAALVDRHAVTIAHVGDSRAYLLRDGSLRQLTTDHTRVNEMLSAGIITPDQALDHPQKNVLVRAVGTQPEVAVDTLSVRLAPGDKLLLCTDGVHGPLRDEEITSIVSREEPAREICRRLVERATESGGRDNATAVLLEVVSIATPASRARWQRVSMLAAAVVALAAAFWFASSPSRSPDPIPGGVAATASPTEAGLFQGILPDETLILSEVDVNLDSQPPQDRAVVWTGRTGRPNLDLFVVTEAGMIRVFHAGGDGIGFQRVRPGEVLDSVTPIDLVGGPSDEVAFLVRGAGRDRAAELRIVSVGPRGPQALLDEDIRRVAGLERRGGRLMVLRSPCCPGPALAVRVSQSSGQLRLVRLERGESSLPSDRDDPREGSSTSGSGES